MKIIYLPVVLTGAVLFAYFAGRAVGDAECRARVAAQNVNAVVAAQAEVIEKQRKIDEQVINTGTGDIRRVLREKYTIAQ